MLLMVKKKPKIEQPFLFNKSMSCFFNWFQNPQPKQPALRIGRPLNLDEFPSTLLELRACEAAIIDHLISIHARIQVLQEPSTKGSLTNLMLLNEKKQLFETRLVTVRKRIQENQRTE